MKIHEIQAELVRSHGSFKEFVMSMDKEAYLRAPEEKWNTGEQLSHVLKSIKAIHTGMVLPKVQLKVMFGKANRPSRTYEGLVTRYNERLAEAYEQPKAYAPETVEYEEREKLLDKFCSYAKKIGDRLNKYDEASIDAYIMPHPLLGKLTIREFAYFTIYHCRHHLELVKRYCGR